MVKAVPMTPELAIRLRDTMRPSDKVTHALGVMLCSKYSAVIVRNGAPVVAIGAREYVPGRFNLWLMATDDISKVRFTLVKTVRKMLAQRGPDNLKSIRLEPISNIPASFRWTDFVRRICPRPEYSEG